MPKLRPLPLILPTSRLPKTLELMSTQYKTSEQSFLEITGVDKTTLTEEEIYLMCADLRRMGLDKPSDITWTIWLQPSQKEAYHYGEEIQMRAMGHSIVDIAKATGRHPVALHKVLAAPKIKASTKEHIQDSVDYFRAELKARANKALGVYDEVLDDATIKPNVRLQAASQIMEHVVGKPQQIVEHKGNLLAEVIAHADRLRDVESSDPSLTPMKDEIDNLIESIIPSNTVVGKRSSSEESGK